MSELPPGWTEATIGDVTEYVSRGKSPKYADKSSLPVVNQRAIRWFGIEKEHLKFIHPDQIPQWTEERYIRAGDVLWNSTGTGTIGRACLVKPEDLAPPKVVDSHVTIVRPRRDAIESRYLFAWIRSPQVQHSIGDLATGTTNQIELSRGTVMGSRLPLAPLAEQKLIADRLDLLLSRVETCRKRLERVPVILKHLRQSVLVAATTGELSKDWREDASEHKSGKTLVQELRRRHGEWSSHVSVRKKQTKSATKIETQRDDGLSHSYDSLPPSWGIALGSEVVEPGAEIVYGIVQPGPKLDKGVPYVRGMDIEHGRILVNQLLKTSPEIAARYSRAAIRGGDVLLGIIRATKVAIVPDELDGANITQGTARFRPSKAIRSRYLAAVLESPITQRWLHDHYRGIDMPGLNLADVRRVPVPLPPVAEQDEILRRLEHLLSAVDTIEARYASALARVEGLAPALLAKAFRGELVPQDPTDESARVLLERIRSNRIDVPAKSKKLKIGRSPMMALTPENLRTIIESLPSREFTFAELRRHVPPGYEELKDVVFELMSDPTSGLKQIFNTKAREMRFQRSKP